MEITEILDYLGVPDFDIENGSVDEFKERFKQKFLTREEALDDEEVDKKVSGRLYGKLSTLAKREFGFKNGDIEGKGLDEIIMMGKEALTSKISNLEAKLTETNTDEKYNQIKAELDEANQKLAETSSTIETLTSEKENIISDYENKFTSFKINNALNGVKANINFRQMNDVERIGYETYLKDNYSFHLNAENGNEELVVLDKSGKRIPNPNKAGSYLGVEEVMKKDAEKFKLLVVNNGGNPPPNPPKEDEGNGEPTRKLPSHILQASKKRSEEMAAKG